MFGSQSKPVLKSGVNPGSGLPLGAQVQRMVPGVNLGGAQGRPGFAHMGVGVQRGGANGAGSLPRSLPDQLVAGGNAGFREVGQGAHSQASLAGLAQGVVGGAPVGGFVKAAPPMMGSAGADQRYLGGNPNFNESSPDHVFHSAHENQGALMAVLASSGLGRPVSGLSAPGAKADKVNPIAGGVKELMGAAQAPGKQGKGVVAPLPVYSSPSGVPSAMDAILRQKARVGGRGAIADPSSATGFSFRNEFGEVAPGFKPVKGVRVLPGVVR